MYITGWGAKAVKDQSSAHVNSQQQSGSWVKSRWSRLPKRCLKDVAIMGRNQKNNICPPSLISPSSQPLFIAVHHFLLLSTSRQFPDFITNRVRQCVHRVPNLRSHDRLCVFCLAGLLSSIVSWGALITFLKRGATNQSEINSYISYIMLYTWGLIYHWINRLWEPHVLSFGPAEIGWASLLLAPVFWVNFSIFGAKTQQLVNAAQWTGQSTQKFPLKEADKLPHIWALRTNIYQHPIQDIFQKHSLPSHPIPTHP